MKRDLRKVGGMERTTKGRGPKGQGGGEGRDEPFGGEQEFGGRFQSRSSRHLETDEGTENYLWRKYREERTRTSLDDYTGRKDDTTLEELESLIQK